MWLGDRLSTRSTPKETPASTQTKSTSTTDTVPPPPKSWTTQILSYLKEQWFVFALGLVILIASQIQVPLANQENKQTIVSYTCVSLIFLITGLTLPTKALIENYTRWKFHLFVQIQCFLLTSSIIYGIVTACASNPDFMDEGLLVGLVLLGCVPTTLSSNVVMTRQSGGNTAMTVVQSTVGNFLGPFLTPALLAMYLDSPVAGTYTEVLPLESGGYGDIYRRVFKQLGLSIFVPLVIGQIVRNLSPEKTKKIITTYKINKLASFSLLTIIWSAYDQAFASHAFETLKASNTVFLVFISIALFILFLSISFFLSLLWLNKADTISVCYCVPAKTPAIGVPLTQVIWVGLSVELSSKIQIPMVIYQGLQIVAGSLLTTAFRAWIGEGALDSKGASDAVEADSRDIEAGKGTFAERREQEVELEDSTVVLGATLPDYTIGKSR